MTMCYSSVCSVKKRCVDIYSAPPMVCGADTHIHIYTQVGSIIHAPHQGAMCSSPAWSDSAGLSKGNVSTALPPTTREAASVCSQPYLYAGWQVACFLHAATSCIPEKGRQAWCAALYTPPTCERAMHYQLGQPLKRPVRSKVDVWWALPGQGSGLLCVTHRPWAHGAGHEAQHAA